MAFNIVTVEVEDYDRWRSKFDSMAGHRREHGLTGERVFQDAADPNRVTVVIEGDQSHLEAYSGSQALKEAMAEGGVMGPPSVMIADEVT